VEYVSPKKEELLRKYLQYMGGYWDRGTETEKI